MPSATPPRQVLVLDEADRLLELGFQAEVEEVVNACPRSRQTMLFSATISSDVAQLAKLSLEKPLQIKVSASPIAWPRVWPRAWPIEMPIEMPIACGWPSSPLGEQPLREKQLHAA